MRFISLTKFVVILVCFSANIYAQAGITASPPKVYFKLAENSTSIQNVSVSNPLNKDLEVGVSLGDWNYDSLGTNSLFDPGTLKISCASWIKVLPGSYFTLLPGERKDLSIELSVPADVDKNIPVRTAMVYFTQLNPSDSKNKSGAAIRVSVKMGIKIYHSFPQTEKRGLEVLDFKDVQPKILSNTERSPGILQLNVENTGNIWTEGKIQWELLNTQTGEKTKLTEQAFFSLPGDKTILTKELPVDLKKGRYTATAVINFGKKDELKLVELEFELEK